MTCGIYEIVNAVNGKRYVGSSVDIEARWKHHLWQLARKDHHSVLLQRAWDKYGKDAFEFKTIKSCDEGNIHQEEQIEIDTKSEYNIAPIAGSNAGHKWTDEQRGRHRLSKIEFYKENPEVRQKQSEASRNSHARPWVRDKISQKTKEAHARPDVREKLSNNTKARWSDIEYRSKMSQMAVDNINRPEHKEAIAESNRRPRSEVLYNFFHRDHGHRHCTQWELKEEFNNLRRGNLSQVCSGCKGSHMGWRIEKAPD